MSICRLHCPGGPVNQRARRRTCSSGSPSDHPRQLGTRPPPHPWHPRAWDRMNPARHVPTHARHEEACHGLAVTGVLRFLRGPGLRTQGTGSSFFWGPGASAPAPLHLARAAQDVAGRRQRVPPVAALRCRGNQGVELRRFHGHHPQKAASYASTRNMPPTGILLFLA
jgi:hypothetical protein